ncbi:rhodanese-like domain-containing protein [Nitratifractor sp.]
MIGKAIAGTICLLLGTVVATGGGCVEGYRDCMNRCTTGEVNASGCLTECGKAKAACEEASRSYKIVDLRRVKHLYNARRALFVDARSFEKYVKGTIPGALNLPLKRFKRMRKWLPADKEAPIVVFCDGLGCGRSAKLARKLLREGYGSVMVYEGGYPEWKRRRLPILATPRPCPEPGGAYRPTRPVTIDGVKIFVDPEEGSRIDARWIAPLLRSGRVPEGLTLIDVRPSEQYARGHLPGAISVPFDPEARSLDLSKLPKRGPILLSCRQGTISTDAWFSLPDALQKRSYILDASVECRAGHCRVEPH